MAASATFALNAELCVRRARLAIVTPDLRHSRRLQAEAPLIDLSEFGQPALRACRKAWFSLLKPYRSWTSPSRPARSNPVSRFLTSAHVGGASFGLAVTTARGQWAMKPSVP